MKNNIYILLATIAGYTIAPIVHGTMSDGFVFNFEETIFILIASPYCMIRYLLVSHKFFPVWQAITTYLGCAIWLGSFWIKPTDKTLLRIKLILAFSGAFIWNLGFHESGRYFLSA